MEFRSDQSIYLQIADHISELILSGTWPEGAKIPSIRELAVELEVNPNTVLRTYGYLQEREVIFNKRGIGYFVAAGALENTRRLVRETFTSEVLPRIFKTMELLELTPADLNGLYAQYQTAND